MVNREDKEYLLESVLKFEVCDCEVADLCSNKKVVVLNNIS